MKILITTPANAYATNRLVDEGKSLGIEIVCVDVSKAEFNINPTAFDALWVRQANPYYNEVIELARKFNDQQKIIIDSRIPEFGIQDNKFELASELISHGVAMPKTERLSDISIERFSYPFVLKWMYGAGAKHVYLVEDEKRLTEIVKKYPANELIHQEYIAADFEYNVITIGYKSLPVVVKYKTHPFKKVTDLENFEIVDAIEVPELISIAEKGSRVLGRELAKSDILEKDGQYYLLEVNRQPGLKPFEDATKVNVAKIFLEYIIGKVS